MGCASSTPMIATGSDMLKHVASDATKSAEEAVQDISQNLGKTMETAKESVGTAITGIAHDLGNTFADKVDALDDVKNNLMEKLHLNPNAEQQHADIVAETSGKLLNEASSRAPTPIPGGAVKPNDTDSLKTSSPEPEIEEALANSSGDSPPTPKPSISELERLSAELEGSMTPTDTTTAIITNELLSNATSTAPAALNRATNDAPSMERWRRSYEEKEQRRPNTTEWELYADMLAHYKKFHANEKSLAKRQTAHKLQQQRQYPLQLAQLPGNLRQSSMNRSETRRQLDPLNTVAQPVQSLDATSVPPALLSLTLPAANNNSDELETENNQLETALNNAMSIFGNSLVPLGHPRTYRDEEESWESDTNHNTSSSADYSHRSSARINRRRMPRSYLTNINAKKLHRQLTSLSIGYGLDLAYYGQDRIFKGGGIGVSGFNRVPGFRGPGFVARGGFGNRFVTGSVPTPGFVAPIRVPNTRPEIVTGRRFDYNPQRMRIGDSPQSASSPSYLPVKRNFSRVPFKPNTNNSISRKWGNNSMRLDRISNTRRVLGEHSSSSSPIKVQTLPVIPSRNANREGTFSRSSRSSTNNSIVIRSTGTTPLTITYSPGKASSINSNNNNAHRDSTEYQLSARRVSVHSNQDNADEDDDPDENNDEDERVGDDVDGDGDGDEDDDDDDDVEVGDNDLGDVNKSIDDDDLTKYKIASPSALINTRQIKLKNSYSPIRTPPSPFRQHNSNSRCDTPETLNSSHKMSISHTRSPSRIQNTSSFLSSPRTSPFPGRKSYAEQLNDKENKINFIADLSSVNENRQRLTPSPYKIRERCAVCYNKYVIK